MNELRIGIAGLGNMGRAHAQSILAGRIKGLELAAVSDVCERNLLPFSEVNTFQDSSEMIHSGLIDALIIATPHYFHTTIGIEALNAGLHVLTEKPLSVHKADCERLLAAHTDESKVFAAMFNQRTDPRFRKLRRLIREGELGEVRRINWIITDWFRTELYYSSGGWRATWKGEGGGVLLNQCPHQLDLMWWLFGAPARLRAFCRLGRYHDIEVEDDVTAYLEYPNGASGVFITTTGEAPGTNRLEIAAERGRVVLDGGRIAFTRNEVAMSEFSRTAKRAFATPETWRVEIPTEGIGGQHEEVLQNFADAILEGAELLAPAAEGIHSVELANAMLYSSMTGQTIELPLDSAAYEAHLQKLIAESTFEKKVVEGEVSADDFADSFKNLKRS